MATSQKLQKIFGEPNFSPSKTCVWSFEFSTEAKLGDILVVEIEGLKRTDLYYAQGVNELSAIGRSVQLPIAGVIKVRYPNLLYLTLVNKDEIKTELESQITFNYWVEPVDPALMFEEYST